jgi:hypothetical protein
MASQQIFIRLSASQTPLATNTIENITIKTNLIQLKDRILMFEILSYHFVLDIFIDCTSNIATGHQLQSAISVKGKL